MLVPSISPFNVWDLPWCYWQAYAALVDEHLKQAREAAKSRV